MTTPEMPSESHDEPAPADDAARPLSRRTFVTLASGLLLAGCTSGTRTRGPLPAPPWSLADRGVGTPAAVPAAPAGGGVPGVPTFTGVHARSAWAKGRPVPTLLSRMTPIRAITVHHDAEYNTGRTAADTRARLESIRRYHRSMDWADIGYHYIVDRQGRIWEGRPLGYQGAHVRLNNEGNVGVMLLGNFEQQQPTTAQVAALQRHVTLLRRHFRVPESKLYTHREWPTASTLCPGRSLQSQVDRLRSRRAFA